MTVERAIEFELKEPAHSPELESSDHHSGTGEVWDLRPLIG
jgi:hypothetical protein